MILPDVCRASVKRSRARRFLDNADDIVPRKLLQPAGGSFTSHPIVSPIYEATLRLSKKFSAFKKVEIPFFMHSFNVT